MDIKDKIEKLLAKAEGTNNEHERDAFTAQAQKLMIKWGIDAADLESRGQTPPEQVVQTEKTWRTPFAIGWITFATSIASGMGNLRTLSRKHGNDVRTVYVIGHETDVSNFWVMMNSLELQAMTALEKWWVDAPERRWGLTRFEQYKTRREFLVAFGRVAGQRIHAMRQEVSRDATPGAALVLVTKEKRVNDWIDETYSKLRKGSGITSGLGGRRAGEEAGRRACLGESSLPESRNQLH